MIAFVLFGLVAAASAAPSYYHHHGHHSHRFSDRSQQMNDFFTDDVFDTASFWRRMESDMLEIDRILKSFQDQFALVAATAGVDGNEYKVRMPLAGFEEKDFVVKAREGSLMVQAIHKSDDGMEKNYIDVRTLPPNVDPSGVWTYADEVLTITFPIKGASTEVVTEDNVTQAPSSREEMGNRGTDDVEDVDVGLATKDNDIKTNEILPSNGVEATTYAVDLKDQYEFVPVHYRK